MIFRPEMAKAVRSGKKTQTRRIINGDCRYQPGRSYAIQSGRGKPAVGRLTVLEVREEPLGAITLQDAKREGFRTTQDFREYWTELHGSFDPGLVVHVISFVLGDQTDKPRLLKARPGHEGEAGGDYTSVSALALRGAGEEIGERRQTKYALAADSARKTGLADHRERLLSVVGVLRLEAAKLNAGSAVARKRLKSVEHQLRAYDREMRRSA